MDHIAIIERDYRVHSSAYRQYMKRFQEEDDEELSKQHLNRALLFFGAMDADKRRLDRMKEAL